MHLGFLIVVAFFDLRGTIEVMVDQRHGDVLRSVERTHLNLSGDVGPSFIFWFNRDASFSNVTFIFEISILHFGTMPNFKSNADLLIFLRIAETSF